MRTLQILKPFALAFAFGVATIAGAQTWPTKPVKVIVTFPPGGSSDVVARVIAPLLAQKLGQPFVVDNKPGAGATIGGGEVARAPADGYTLMLSNTAPISLSPFMLEPQPYDPTKGFTHIAYIGSVPNVFVVHPSVPAKTIPEFIAWAKQQKDPIPYGSGGIGSIGHIVGELFAAQAGIKLNHVGYKGSAPMHNDLLGGQILFAIDTLPQNVQFQKSGKLRLLAVTSTKRAAMVPEVPTVLELGYPKLVAENFFGISGPAGVTKNVVTALHAATLAALDDPKLQKTFEELGIATHKMSPEEFAQFVQKQVAEWAPAVKASGAKLN
ncbi:MAG: tripartite tricarboxylate transporter substrate binding protein [Casimicrobiaceae bacterium]